MHDYTNVLTIISFFVCTFSNVIHGFTRSSVHFIRRNLVRLRASQSEVISVYYKESIKQAYYLSKQINMKVSSFVQISHLKSASKFFAKVVVLFLVNFTLNYSLMGTKDNFVQVLDMIQLNLVIASACFGSYSFKLIT